MATISDSSSFKSFSSKKTCMTEEESEIANYLLYKVETQIGKRPSDDDLSTIFNQTFKNSSNCKIIKVSKGYIDLEIRK